MLSEQSVETCGSLTSTTTRYRGSFRNRGLVSWVDLFGLSRMCFDVPQIGDHGASVLASLQSSGLDLAVVSIARNNCSASVLSEVLTGTCTNLKSGQIQ